MAILTVVSFYDHISDKKINLKIASDDINAFNEIKKILNIIYKNKKPRIEHVKVSNVYNEIAPLLNNYNYATYWKFDLFRSLKKNEILFYMDVDSICVLDFDVSNLIKVFDERSVKLMGVHAPRPNLERYSVLQLKSPFQYFNAGVLIGLKDKSYDVNNIVQTTKLLRSLDPLDLMWHDQDIFNYLFREKIFLLDPSYNFSTGFLNKEFRVTSLVNDEFINILRDKVKIVHFSGNYILNNKFHPYINVYHEKLKGLQNILLNSSINKKITIEYLEQIKIIINLRDTKKLDYILQTFYIRKRFFSKEYYPSFKSLIKKILGRKIYNQFRKLFYN